jgi:hypothetical protein
MNKILLTERIHCSMLFQALSEPGPQPYEGMTLSSRKADKYLREDIVSILELQIVSLSMDLGYVEAY